MSSTYNEEKSVVAERFIRTSKNKIYKYMTSIPKNLYVNKLADIFNKHNKHIITPLKWSCILINQYVYWLLMLELNWKLIVMREYQNINTFLQKFTPQCLKTFLWWKQLKYIVLWTYVTEELFGEDFLETLDEKELQKTSQTKFRIKKVIKKKCDKLYLKWKGYDDSFNSWLIRKKSWYKTSYFAEPYTNSKNKKLNQIFLIM